MKRLFPVILLLIAPFLLAKGENLLQPDSINTIPDSKFKPIERPFIMTVSVGPNFNTGGNKNTALFGSRPDVCTQFDWRMNIAFARRWTAYIDLGLNFYRIEKPEIVEAIMNALMPGFGCIHPSASVGGSYTAYTGRWMFTPRTGFGYEYVNKSDKSKSKDGVKIETKRKIVPLFWESGLTCAFRTSKLCAITLDLNYRCPLQPGKVTVKTTKDNISTVEHFKSRSWANDLSLSLGFQLQADLSRKK